MRETIGAAEIRGETKIGWPGVVEITRAWRYDIMRFGHTIWATRFCDTIVATRHLFETP